MTVDEALSKQCRAGGMFVQRRESPDAHGDIKVELLPTFVSCIANGCAHWVDESGAGSSPRFGHCGLNRS